MKLGGTLWVFLAILFLNVIGMFAAEVGGVNMPNTLKADGTDLVLNGAGTRTKFFIKVYVAGLYLNQKAAMGLKL